MKIKLFFSSLAIFLIMSALPVFAANYIVTAADDADLSKYELEVVFDELGMYLADEETAKTLLENGDAISISEDQPLILPDTVEYDETISNKAEVMPMSGYNDPYYSEEVYFEQNGIAEYIDTYEPSGEVRIAVIDTGVNREHQEFANANIETGYNFVLNSTDTSDIYRHGTMVTGIIAAGANDGMGMAGIAPNATIIPLVAMTRIDNEVYGTSSNLLQAIRAAVDTYDCDIITTSLGVTSGYTEINKAVEYAVSRGVIVIGAAGNSGNDDDSSDASALSYPASSPGAISVGATDTAYNRAAYSQRNYRVNVVACGGYYHMPSNTSTNTYVLANGTSFSTPVIAGITALFFSEHPDITPEEYLSILEGGSVYINQDYTGEGIPNCMHMEAIYNMTEDNDVYIIPSIINDNEVLSLKLHTSGAHDDMCIITAYFSGGKYYGYSSKDEFVLRNGIYHYNDQMRTGNAHIFVVESLDNLKPISNVYEYVAS